MFSSITYKGKQEIKKESVPYLIKFPSFPIRINGGENIQTNSNVEAIPSNIGAAIRFMTSALVPVCHKIGVSPINVVGML